MYDITSQQSHMNSEFWISVRLISVEAALLYGPASLQAKPSCRAPTLLQLSDQLNEQLQ